MDNIRIIFILPKNYNDESESSQIMQEAYEQCKQNISTRVTWIKEKEFNEKDVNKTDFVVFEEFEGNLYENLKETKCARILGPWTVNVCLMEGKPIPNFPWPIYNVAMYNCIVTCSYLSKVVKAELKEKVEKMGGCYVDTLLAKNTHLITGSAKSEKYLMAAEAGLKLMCPSWVEEVWQVSQTVNIHANDERFNKHECLPFQNLVICSTGITSVAERKKIEKMVNENGGVFTGKLNLSTTDILICSGENCTNSEKYKAARQQKNIKCVNFSWIIDSIEKGYALPHSQYQVQKMTSTPTKPDELVNPEFSMISAIGVPNLSQKAVIEETMASPWSPVNNRTSSKRKASVPEYETMIENLDIKKAKKAGQYLDGCSVYIVGFGSEHTEKLNKIINLSGATRYDSFSDRVTHVIVGDPNFHEVKLIRNKGVSCAMVTLQWLIDSIDNGLPVSEEKYLLGTSNFDTSDVTSSPLSKKGLNLLRSQSTLTERDFRVNLNNNPHFQDNSRNEIVQQYLRQNSSSQEDTLAKLLDGADTNLAKPLQEPLMNEPTFKPPNISTQDSSLSVTQDESGEICIQFFEHLKFLVIGFDEDEHAILKEKIECYSGELVQKSFKGIPDFLVVPIFNDKEIHHTATEVVNNLFIYECEQIEGILKEIAYYHRPFSLPEAKPLQNCVITLSSYTGYERIFLRNLVDSLGGVAQEQFARVTSEAKGVRASTHLVTFEASGKKYEAALKWGLPVVKKEWLLECYKTGKLISETEYVIGLSKAPERKISDESNLKVVQEQDGKTNDSKGSATPINSPGPSRINRVLTPVNQVTPVFKRFLDSAEKPFSQVTPINKIMQNFRETNVMLYSNSPKEPKKYKIPEPWMNIKTPDTPLGACLTPNPSPGLRKQWEYWLRQFPDKSSPTSTASTPLSEIKKQLWNKVLKNDRFDQPNFNDSEKEATDENSEISSTNEETESKTPENNQLVSRLQQLEDMLNASGGGGKRQSTKFQATIPAPGTSNEFKDSQPCTVGWDFQDQELQRESRQKVFSLSGIGDDETRLNMIQQIEHLGGVVSDLSNYDPSCTHLLCSKPARNEKSLSCMAAGKWVLHTSYLKKSMEAGHFLDEEEFEFGNPKARGNFGLSPDRETELRMQRMYWWRNEISKRGYKAFNDMRAIVVAQKRDPIIRVIEAGGGTVIDIKPPFEDPVHATHCFLEQKSVKDYTLYEPLAKQGIYLLNTVFISDFLHYPNKDIRDCILPHFVKYYARG